MKRIQVLTSTRADYGILRPLLLALNAEPDVHLQILVTGTHLHPDYGNTVQEIAADSALDRIELPIMDTTRPQPATAILARLLTQLENWFLQQPPDLLILLGDRFEIMGAATAATLHNIPIVHLHGGELTLGAQDDVFRHAITKMSHLHFTSTERYRQRVIQLGEDPQTVFHVGALALDAIHQVSVLPRSELARSCGCPLDHPFYLVTYHPETREPDLAVRAVDTLAEVLLAQPGMFSLITGANADQGGQRINQHWRAWQQRYPERFGFELSLGQRRYFSALRYASAVIGNSSSGIIEAPSFHIPTLDIGDRQLGREKAASVLHCSTSKAAISAGFLTIASPEFQAHVQQVTNPYGDGLAARRILDILRQLPWPPPARKGFFDAL